MPYRPSLDYFLELTKWPSISRAAEELHITQQSLSIYLKRLENYYGATLVERQPSLRLTEEGAALRDAAEKIARIYEELDQTLQKNGQPGLIRLGCMRVQTDELLQALPFQAFRSRFPHVQIEIMEEHTPILAQKLRDGQLDFYLGIRDFCTAETEYHFFREFPVYVLAAPSLLEKYFGIHWKERAESWKNGIRLEEMREIPAIFPPDHSRMRRTADQYARERGYELQVTFESFSSPLTLQMVGQDAGFALSSQLPPPGSPILAFPLADPRITRKVYCVREKHRQFPAYMEAFWKMMRKA